MKRIGVMLLLASGGVASLGACQTVEETRGVARAVQGPGAPDECERRRTLLDDFYLTPHQRADLAASLREAGCDLRR